MPQTSDIHKEVKILRSFVRSLEDELTECKLNFQRECRKKTQLNRQLTAQVDELRENEVILKRKVAKLTTELALLKRTKMHSRPSTYRTSSSPSRQKYLPPFDPQKYLPPPFDPRNSSCESTGRDEAKPRIRSNSWNQDAFFDRLSRSRSITRNKPAEGFLSQSRRTRSISNTNRSNTIGARLTRPPLPYTGTPPRFNPTAYTIEKNRKLNETRNRLQKINRTRMGDRDSSPRSSHIYSHDSSRESLVSDFEDNERSFDSRLSKNRSRRNNIKNGNESTYEELTQIDQRLARLKKFMSDNIN